MYTFRFQAFIFYFVMRLVDEPRHETTCNNNKGSTPYHLLDTTSRTNITTNNSHQVGQHSTQNITKCDLGEVRTEIRVRGSLRHCATSREVAGSIPDDVTGIFH